jgi:MFS transporter, MHS family, proline/betaine transporter
MATRLSPTHGADALRSPRRGGARAVAAATAGNIVEWYDFAVYGYFAATIGKLFFPTGDELSSLLLAVGTFGVGFVMRPVGALVLGAYADRHGRKSALLVTIIMMALGTGLIGLSPTFESIGRLAPVIIVFARMLQGFSAGGELGSSTAFLVEHAPAGKRRFYASLQMCSQGAALLLGSLTGAILTSGLNPPQLESWGWRVPFLLGLLIGPIGLYIRSQIDETPEYKAAAHTKTPITDAVREHRGAVLIGFGVTIAWTVCVYAFLVYMPTYAVRELGLPPSASLWANSIGLVMVTLFSPLFGILSDRVGPRVPMIAASGMMVIITYPLFLLMTNSPTLGTLISVQIVFGILTAMYTGPAAALMSELYPTNIRSTGLSIGYNFAVTIFGGFAPFIATWLIAATGSKLAPTFYVVAANAISFAVVAFALSHRSRSTAAVGDAA